MSTTQPSTWRTLLWLPLLFSLPACSVVPRTAEHDASLPQLRLNGHVFHSETVGAAHLPTIIVLHGGPGADYRYLLGLSALSDHFRVVFYDQLGSGLSQRVAATEITPATFIDDLHAIIMHYSADRPVHLLGHSWGAMLASAYAGTHPENVASMVLAEPGFLDRDTLGEMNTSGWPGWRVVGGFARAWLGKWRVSNANDPYARDDWFLLQVMPLTQPAAALCNGQLPLLTAWRFGSPAFEATLGRMLDDPTWAQSLNFAQGIDRYHGPVLFLRGACNTAQDENYQRRMMSKFSAASNAQLISIENAGHFMFNDQPEASITAVRHFLSATTND